MKRIFKLLIYGLFLFLFCSIFSLPKVRAQAPEEIKSFDTNIQINKDASVNITEHIVYYFDNEKHGIFRTIPVVYTDQDNREFTLDLKINSILDQNQKNIPYQTSRDGSDLKIKIGDANKTVIGDQEYFINYTVIGAINYFNDYDELYWNATGDDWQVPIFKVTSTVQLPDDVDQSAIRTRCFIGQTGSTEELCTHNISDKTVTFTAENDFLTIVVGWNKGVVKIIDKNYKVDLLKKYHFESNWFYLLPLFTILISLYFYQRLAHDPKKVVTIAPEFAPPKEFTPAQIGTILDKKVDSRDLTADVINWAVNGHLKIREEEKKWWRGTDFTLIKVKDLPESAASYQKALFENIFAGKKELKLSTLKQSVAFSKKWSQIRHDIVDDLTKKEYFQKSSPVWRWGIGCILPFFLLILALVIFLLSTSLGLSLGISGLSLGIFIFINLKRTGKGVNALQKILGFKEFITKVEKYRAHWAEKENIFEEYLPYAILFGVTQKWAQTFKDVCKDKPDWYSGNWAAFNTYVFVNSLNSFGSSVNTAAVSSVASTGGSGFSGGGSSGGGFGGGGGGSW